MRTLIQLIVGLGNPGPSYAKTRHNAGAWLVETLAHRHHQTLKMDTKFHGRIGDLHLQGHDCRLLIPATFMNENGMAVRAVAHYYKLPPEAILVAHDDLDFAPGIVRLKKGGGDGGHNGLHNVIDHLQSQQFCRLRIGIGHPGHKDRVHDYVLSPPSQKEREEMLAAIDHAITRMPDLLAGDMEKATQALHTGSS